jgi:site-specific recombinase XerD
MKTFCSPHSGRMEANPCSQTWCLKRLYVRPLLRAGVNKVIGWHSFRHSLATNLRSLGVDVKVAQELLRHSNSRTTLDIYTQAVSADKRQASQRHIELLTGSVPLRTVENDGIAASD